MPIVQLSENTIFTQSEKTATLDGKFGAIILMPSELAALTSHLTKQVLQELESDIEKLTIGTNYAGLWIDGFLDAKSQALSFIRSKLNPKETEHGK